MLWLVDKFNYDTKPPEFEGGILIGVRAPLVMFFLGIPSCRILVMEGLDVDDALYYLLKVR